MKYAVRGKDSYFKETGNGVEAVDSGEARLSKNMSLAEEFCTKLKRYNHETYIVPVMIVPANTVTGMYILLSDIVSEKEMDSDDLLKNIDHMRNELERVIADQDNSFKLPLCSLCKKRCSPANLFENVAGNKVCGSCIAKSQKLNQAPVAPVATVTPITKNEKELPSTFEKLAAKKA
jgi:hypothetical protein